MDQRRIRGRFRICLLPVISVRVFLSFHYTLSKTLFAGEDNLSVLLLNFPSSFLLPYNQGRGSWWRAVQWKALYVQFLNSSNVFFNKNEKVILHCTPGAKQKRWW